MKNIFKFTISTIAVLALLGCNSEETKIADNPMAAIKDKNISKPKEIK